VLCRAQYTVHTPDVFVVNFWVFPMARNFNLHQYLNFINYMPTEVSLNLTLGL